MMIMRSRQAAVEAPPDEQRLVLRNLDWSAYRTISEALKNVHIKLTFDRGTLEFMTKSRLHERFSRLFHTFVLILGQKAGVPVSSCGAMTCDREDLDRGVEADEGFYLANEPVVRNKDEIDLSTDPPPDLMVEIDLSSPSQRRLTVYEAIRVPEVWCYDGQIIRVYQLGPDSRFVAAERSRFFPFLEVSALVRFLEQRTQMDEGELALAFRAWVREQIAAYRSSNGHDRP